VPWKLCPVQVQRIGILFTTQKKGRKDAICNGRPNDLTPPPLSVFAKFRQKIADRNPSLSAALMVRGSSSFKLKPDGMLKCFISQHLTEYFWEKRVPQRAALPTQIVSLGRTIFIYPLP